VNPLGIQGDTRYAGGKEDGGFDLVFYSAGKIDKEGYAIEVKIPLKSIRYTHKKTIQMGVLFERKISRESEQGTFPHMSPDRGFDFLNQMAPLVYHDLKQYTLFELLPAVTYHRNYAEEQGKLELNKRRGDFSLTAKYGLTSDLILDGTYNPDFSQVEADAGQVDINLRYSLFYPEKRPFFQEGNENFNLAVTSQWDSLQSAVHTRTIVDPIAGIKLSGKIGNKNMIASIFAIDELGEYENGSNSDNAYFTIFRYKRAFKGDSYLGGIYAGREKKNHFNRVLGFDGQARISKASMLSFHGLFSSTKQDELSDIEDGHAMALQYQYGTRNIDYRMGLTDLSSDFITETGYVTRTGIFRGELVVKPKFYPKSKFLRRLDAEFHTRQTRDKPSSRWETYNHLSFIHHLMGTSVLLMRYAQSTEIFLGERFDISGWTFLFNSQITKQLFASCLYRNRQAIYFSEEPFQGRETILTAGLSYLPSERLSTELDFTYYDFFRKSDSQKIYDYPITRLKLTYQLNKYLFFRGILEYNEYRKELFTDFLASFTYIPGTVIHFGYGSLYNKSRYHNGQYLDSHRFMEIKRGFFFKASYLWRL
jgi:hypothetical protein